MASRHCNQGGHGSAGGSVGGRLHAPTWHAPCHDSWQGSELPPASRREASWSFSRAVWQVGCRLASRKPWSQVSPALHSRFSRHSFQAFTGPQIGGHCHCRHLRRADMCAAFRNVAQGLPTQRPDVPSGAAHRVVAHPATTKATASRAVFHQHRRLALGPLTLPKNIASPGRIQRMEGGPRHWIPAYAGAVGCGAALRPQAQLRLFTRHARATGALWSHAALLPFHHLQVNQQGGRQESVGPTTRRCQVTLALSVLNVTQYTEHTSWSRPCRLCLRRPPGTAAGSPRPLPSKALTAPWSCPPLTGTLAAAHASARRAANKRVPVAPIYRPWSPDRRALHGRSVLRGTRWKRRK